MKAQVLIAVQLACLVLAADATHAQDSGSRLEKLQAFARTFGYVRYFHPSDQAALLDWESMAYYGVDQVLESEDGESTKLMIERLFHPLVVGLELYEGAEKPHPETKDVVADKIVAWQHQGIGFGRNPLYRSVRLNRDRLEKKQNAGPFGNLITSMDPSEFVGKKIRYRFDAKVEQGRCRLQGWWRVDRENGEMGLFENMSDRPIRDKKWKQYELVGTVQDDAKALTLGVMFFGSGSALVDNVRLEQLDGDNWVAIELRNSDFEDGDGKPEGWTSPVPGYSLAIEKQDASNGKQSVRIGSADSVVAGNAIFELLPKLGEVIDVPISNDLRLRMPLALPIEQEYSSGDDSKVDQLIKAINGFDPETANQNIASIANAVLLWNVFQHFYPYFDQVKTDWDAVLESGLKNALTAKTRDQATKNLKWMVAQLHDGHGRLMDRQEMRKIRFAPVRFDWVEDRLIVVGSEDENFKIADVITQVDGKPASDFLKEREALISGSPQWKRYRSTSELSHGNQNLTFDVIAR